MNPIRRLPPIRLAVGWYVLVALTASLVLMAVQGEVAGFAFPFDQTVWGFGFGLSGFVIGRAHPDNPVGRMLLWAAAFVVTNQIIGQIAYGSSADLRPLWDSPLHRGVLLGASVLWAVPLVLVFSAMLRFPDGEFVGRWHRITFWVWVAALVVGFLGDWSVPVAFHDGESIERTIEAVPPDVAGIASMLSGVGILFLLPVNIVSGLRAGPIRRRQLGLVYVAVAFAIALGAIVETGLGSTIGIALFPFSIMAAVTRYRLYEIDRIVSRTITYGVVLAVLAALYFGLVVLLRGLLPFEGSVPVALSTLAVAFLFLPLARWVQNFVDRRFFRSRYDASDVVASFADELRSTLDPTLAAARAESVVAETFQAESVSVWMAGDPV